MPSQALDTSAVSTPIDRASLLTPFLELEPSLRSKLDMFTDSTLPETVLIAIKNAPYTTLEKSNTWYEAFTSRIRWAGGWGHALWSTVQNLALAVIYSLAVVFTVGQFEGIKDGAQKYWTQTAIAIVSWVTAGIGVWSPALAETFTLSFVGIVFSLMELNGDVSTKVTDAANKAIRGFFNQNQAAIKQAIEEMPQKEKQDQGNAERAQKGFDALSKALGEGETFAGALDAVVNFIPKGMVLVLPTVKTLA